MIKNTITKRLKRLLIYSVAAVLCILIIGFSGSIGTGIKNGIAVCLNQLIPSLFPFMVFSSYISLCPPPFKRNSIADKICNKVFGMGAICLTPYFLGLSGGYPIGAKTIAALRKEKRITQNEAERLFYWCINPAPAFTITAVGTFMLGSTPAGIIIYASCVLASLTTGLLCRFLADGEKAPEKAQQVAIPYTKRLVNAVSSGSSAMLSVCAWVLTFCCLSSIFELLPVSKSTLLFIRLIAEVTTGSGTAAAEGMPLPVIAAVIGFGGFAVICQICVYADLCRVDTKRLICSRLVNSALSAIYCNLILKIFPLPAETFATITVAHTSLHLYHSIFAALLLLVMCCVLILEVDNRKKMC